MPKIEVSSPLRRYICNSSILSVEGSTIKEVVNNLVDKYPDMKELFYHGSTLSSKVIIVVDNTDIRRLDNEYTKVSESSKIYILPVCILHSSPQL